MTDTTVPTGWTPDVSPKPATLPQLRALLNKLQGMTECAPRNNAIAAVDNAIDLLAYYREWLDFADAIFDAEEERQDAQERADLYALGMGR